MLHFGLETAQAFAVYLHAVDTAQGCVSFSYNASQMPAEAELDYIRTYHRIDPRANLAMMLQPGEWMHCWEHFDEDFVARDPFYQDFLIPYGGRYASGVKLLQDGSVIVMLGVHRGHGSRKLDADEIAVCKRLARHLTDALMTHRVTMENHHQRRLGMEMLARMRTPVALVDEQRCLLHANPSAAVLLTHSAAIVESSGRLYCRRPADDTKFMIDLRQLLLHGCVPTDAPARDKLFLRVSAPNGEETLGLYLYTLHPNKTLNAFGDRSLAMVLFHEPKSHLALDPYLVGAAFDLTPAEARVAVAAANGTSPHQIARIHGVSIHTVRSQLQTILEKTGTFRQAELVSLLAALPAAALGFDDGLRNLT